MVHDPLQCIDTQATLCLQQQLSDFTVGHGETSTEDRRPGCQPQDLRDLRRLRGKQAL